MGKGDIKTRRGKISRGTFGVTRPHKKSTSTAVAATKEKPKATKKPAAKKSTAKKKEKVEE